MHDGWTRLFADGADVELTDDGAPALLEAGCELVIDRFAPERTPLARVVEAIESAYPLGGGTARFVPRSSGAQPIVLSARAECPEHGVVLEGALTPRHFSFNARLGACDRCDGVGTTATLVPERLFPGGSGDLGLWEAIDPRVGSVIARSVRNKTLLDGVLARFGRTVDDPVSGWTAEVRAAVLDGLAEPVKVTWTQRWGNTSRTVDEERAWPGLLAVVELSLIHISEPTRPY